LDDLGNRLSEQGEHALAQAAIAKAADMRCGLAFQPDEAELSPNSREI
jgi:hypothetical protein